MIKTLREFVRRHTNLRGVFIFVFVLTDDPSFQYSREMQMVWSLGLFLFKLYYQTTPYDSKTTIQISEILYKTSEWTLKEQMFVLEAQEIVNSHIANLPSKVNTFIRNALTLYPDKRFTLKMLSKVFE